MSTAMNPVQQKISCVYKTGVLDEPSGKRQHQTFRVAATRELNSRATEDGISSARATEKIDGTCCLVAEFQGQPWLWARHDRKPSKVGERRFAQHKKSKANLGEGGSGDKTAVKPFVWNPEKDFKDVPDHWMPALGLEVKDGVAMPDSIGHTPGWVPVQTDQRQHCWHLEAVDLVAGAALILREKDQSSSDLVVESVQLSNLLDQTCELIGTSVNGNPYGLGSKKNPFHILVTHGAMTLTCPDPSTFDAMWEWMTNENEETLAATATNQVEGVVWHCQNGQLYKLHRHHLNLKWPVGEPSLCKRQIHIRVKAGSNPTSSSSTNGHEEEEEGRVESINANKDKKGSLFTKLSLSNDRLFGSLKEVCNFLVEEGS